MGKKGYEPLI